MIWFFVNEKWHAVKEGKMARCGLSPMSDPEFVDAGDKIPPVPCFTCLSSVAEDWSVAETISEAKGRGYLPA